MLNGIKIEPYIYANIWNKVIQTQQIFKWINDETSA